MVEDPNLRVLCVRAVQNSISQSVLEIIKQRIFDLGIEDRFEILNNEIRSTLGTGVIMFKGLQNYNSSNIKSFQGVDICWVEEAQDLSQSAWDDLDPTIRKDGAEIWLSWNPKNKTDPVDQIFRHKTPPEGSIVVNVNIFDNPWPSERNLKQMEWAKRNDPDAYAHVWLGQYLERSDARVIKNWRIEDFEAPEGTIFRLGADFGFSVDPSVLIRCFIQGNTLYIDYEAHEIGCEIVNLPDLFMQIPEAEKWPLIADSARPETISHLRNHGFPKIYGAAKGAKSLEEGIAWLNSFEIVVHPRCNNTIDELTLYKYKIDKETNKPLNLLEDKNNHCIDALRYACEGVRRAQKADRRKAPVSRPTPALSRW